MRPSNKDWEFSRPPCFLETPCDTAVVPGLGGVLLEGRESTRKLQGDTCSPPQFLQQILRSKTPAHGALPQPLGVLPALVPEVLQEMNLWGIGEAKTVRTTEHPTDSAEEGWRQRAPVSTRPEAAQGCRRGV